MMALVRVAVCCLAYWLSKLALPQFLGRRLCSGSLCVASVMLVRVRKDERENNRIQLT